MVHPFAPSSVKSTGPHQIGQEQAHEGAILSEHLEDFLHNQSIRGDHDSQGVFTLSVAKASWKLSQFQLADRAQFPVHLVACAVASGATVFRVHYDGESLRFFFNGPAFVQKDLETLSLPLMGKDVPRRIREFGIAFNSAARHYHAEFFSFTKNGGIRLSFSQDEVHIEELESRGHQGQVFLVQGHKFVPEPFLEQCKFAPLDLSLNGVRHRESFEFGMFDQKLIAHYQRQGEGELMIRPPSLVDYKVRRFQHKDKSRRSLTLALTPTHFAHEHGFVLMADGIRFRSPDLIDSRILCGVIDCSDLEKDLSQSGFLLNESYEAMRSEVQEAVDHFLESLCRQPIDMTGELTVQFQAELLKRFQDRPEKRAVQTFLKPLDTDLRNQSRLNEMGRRAASGEQLEKFEKKRQALRTRASAEYLAGSVSKPLIWLWTEHQMVKSADRDTREVEELITCLQCLHDDSPPEIYPAQSSSYRGDLVQLIVSGGERLPELTHLPRSVSQLLTAATCIFRGGKLVQVSEVTPDWLTAMRIWNCCRQREFVAATAHFGSVTNRSCSAWSDLIWLTFKGRMSWGNQIMWGAKRALDCLNAKTDMQREADFKKIRHGRSLLGQLLLQPRYQGLETQVAVAHLLALEKDAQPGKCFEILGKSLLRQELLSSLDQTGT